MEFLQLPLGFPSSPKGLGQARFGEVFTGNPLSNSTLLVLQM